MWKSTPDQYGRVAIAIHWVSALLIVALLVSGFRADATADAVGKITVLRAHAAMGITILILTLARIAWWRMADRKPPAPEGTTNSQHRAAQLVHVLFYVVILGMAVSGIGMLVLSGAGAILFGGMEDTTPMASSHAEPVELAALAPERPECGTEPPPLDDDARNGGSGAIR